MSTLNETDGQFSQLLFLDMPTVRSALAWACSVRCSGSVVMSSYDLAGALRDLQVPVISGFQSPIEKECLRVLLRGRQPVIVCPARSVANMRIPREWKEPIAEGRLLVVSPFAEHQRRSTAKLAEERNRFVASQAVALFIAHASPNGKIEALAREIIPTGKPVYTFDLPENANLLNIGARPLTVEDAGWVFSDLTSSDGR